MHRVDAFSTKHLHADLERRSVRGGVLTITSQGTQFLLQSISTITLARLLTHEDFGLVAMVMAITSLGQAFADLGLSEATIQRENISHEEVSTLFWINVGVGLALTLITIGLAPVLAWFYREPRIRNITLILSVTFLVGGLRVQHDALLKRQMRFFSIAIRDIVSSALAVPIAIFMAWRGAGYWSIVALPLISNTTRMLLSWVGVKWIPGLPSRDPKIRSMVVFGGNVATSYIMYNINRSADAVLIGWYWGAGPLGLFSRAYNLLMLPVRQFGTPIGNVLVPAFSRAQEDPERFARFYLRAVSLMTWVSTPLFGFLFVAAQPIIVLLLGKAWGEAAPVFQLLAVSALGQLLLDLTVWSFVSRGQSDRLLRLLLTISPILVCSFLIGLPFGIRGVALAGSLALVGIYPWILKFTFRGTELTLQRFGAIIVCPVTLCVMAVVFAEIVLHLLAPHGTMSQLVTGALGFSVVYALSLLIPRVRHEVMSFKNFAGFFKAAE